MKFDNATDGLMGLLGGGQSPTTPPQGGGMFDAYSPQNQTNMQMAMIADMIGNFAGKDVGAMKTMMPLAENARKLRLQNEQRTAAQNMLSGGGSSGGAGGSEWMTPQQKAAIASIARTNPTEAMKMMSTMKMQYDSAGVALNKNLFSQESGLRGEFQKLTKDFRGVQESFGRVVQSAEPGPSGHHAAGDLALVFNYMKMLDPGSVVREGEFATAAKAAGLGETMIAAMKKVDNGDILTASMRQDFVDRSWKLYSEAARGFDTTSGEYVDLSKMYQGVDPSKVVTSDRRYKDDWFKPWFQGLGGSPVVEGDVNNMSLTEELTQALSPNKPTTAQPTNRKRGGARFKNKEDEVLDPVTRLAIDYNKSFGK
tara:strand:- start:1877 stop:2980 length:1104 start_codon:yes stop_codon:yes gene_type:complete